MLRRPLVPLWIARPSRFAGLNVRDSWLVVVALVGMLLATLLVFATPVPAAATGGARATDGQTDIALYDGIVEAVRHGASYYPAAIDAMRAGAYPLKPFITVRLPTLAVVEGALPRRVVMMLLDLLAAHNCPREIDYLSIDTEGSELPILNAFDFSKYDIKIVTVEHNYCEPDRQQIHDLLFADEPGHHD